MARKDPYKVVKVHERIYTELAKKLLVDSEGEFRIPSMNAYCERILWDYATGKLIRGESAQAQSVEGNRPGVRGTGGGWQSPDQPGDESSKEPKGRKGVRK